MGIHRNGRDVFVWDLKKFSERAAKYTVNALFHILNLNADRVTL